MNIKCASLDFTTSAYFICSRYRIVPVCLRHYLRVVHTSATRWPLISFLSTRRKGLKVKVKWGCSSV